jgi:hypothetical protein
VTGIPAHRHDDHQIVYPGRGVLAVTKDKGSWIAPATTTTTITQLGSTVGIGLLLDTLIVRSFWRCAPRRATSAACRGYCS